MHVQKKIKDREGNEHEKLADVLVLEEPHYEFFTIKYSIKFHKGKHKDNTIDILIDLDDLECDSLSSWLVDNDYITEYSSNDDYFTVKKREVFVANWGEKRLEI